MLCDWSIVIKDYPIRGTVGYTVQWQRFSLKEGQIPNRDRCIVIKDIKKGRMLVLSGKMEFEKKGRHEWSIYQSPEHVLTIRECDLIPFNSAFFKFQIFVTIYREIYDLRIYLFEKIIFN